jgi:glucose/arabinose dehydrogenase
VVNERDELGSDLVPDYMTSVQDGGFYGWPYSYYGRIRGRTRQPPQPAIWWPPRSGARLRAGPAHGVARAGAFDRWTRCRPRLPNGMFIGQHGSWNRRPHSGYKVIFVPFQGGRPAGAPR